MDLKPQLEENKSLLRNNFQLFRPQLFDTNTSNNNSPFESKKWMEASRKFTRDVEDNARIRKDKLILDAATAKAAIDTQLAKDLAELNLKMTRSVYMKQKMD